VTLNQALALIKSNKNRDGEKKAHYLVCGFEPVHLKTLLHAYLLDRLSTAVAEVETGVYGDLLGNMALAAQSPAIAAAVVLEWSDIDPRLGLRSSGGWSEQIKPDILSTAQQRYAQIEAELRKLAGRMPVAVAPPGLPLLPIGNTILAQSSLMELELEHQLASFLIEIARLPGVRVVQRSRLDRVPGGERLDAKMELLAGFPYTVQFADAVASALTDVLYQPAPKKGLITDLDDTLWSGIVGEVGVERVSWNQEGHTQTHGLYQQMLGHLASCGVLLAVCSKNETSTVEAALTRKDLFLKADSLFPVCAGWEPKSKSVARILRTWNIGEDAVVFVDDSPMELEEVKRAFPGIACRQFNGKDPAQVWHLLCELRDLFGKPLLMEEDRLRQASIRAAAQIEELGESAASPEFLRSLKATVTLDWRLEPSERRPLELINKTNQFNLNGRRVGEGEWQRYLENRNTVLAVASYSDKFGPLGKVAVVLGTKNHSAVHISHWVMSCRAFSRWLEYHTLDALFRETNAEEITFDFEATDRNKPLQAFFRAIGIGPDTAGTYRLSREGFSALGHALPHEVVDLGKMNDMQAK
jgi:FkbH-like protein